MLAEASRRRSASEVVRVQADLYARWPLRDRVVDVVLALHSVLAHPPGDPIVAWAHVGSEIRRVARERFRVKPGVTGLAQVSGGYATTPERKLKYDLIYMYHQNLPMDVQIVVETLRVVLTGRGAM